MGQRRGGPSKDFIHPVQNRGRTESDRNRNKEEEVPGRRWYVVGLLVVTGVGAGRFLLERVTGQEDPVWVRRV